MVNNLRYNRKGLSTIVTTLIIILLSIVAVGVVWIFVNNTINKQITSNKACFGNYDKVKLNGQYTCYEVSGSNYNLRVSLTIGDIAVDKVIVSVASGDIVKSYEITNNQKPVAGLAMYPSGDTNVILPAQNSGLTYEATGFSSKIDSIQIAPMISGQLCDVSDSLFEIGDCALIT